MARVAFLLPREDMLPQIPALAQKYHLDVILARAIQTDEAVEATRKAMADGADIVVARGLQANLIKANTSVPLVAIQFTAQEIGLLIRKATELVSSPHPRVGLIGAPSMFQDVSHLGELLGVELRSYFGGGDFARAAAEAIDEGADVLIGGDVACQYAAQRGFPAVFISSSTECIENACRAVQRVAYALDLEKRNAAQLQIILDYTVSGLILLDGQGLVCQLNHSSEQLLNAAEPNWVGKPVWELLPALTAETLEPVLQRGEELTALHLRHGESRFLTTISPVTAEDRPSGAVISLTDSQQFKTYADRQRKELYHQGFTAPFTFDTFIARSHKTQALLEQARHCARFNAPVVIQGEFGTEKEELAQCIHNAGDSPENAFVHFNCNCMDPDAEEKLFGPQGLVERAQGILFLDEVSRLSPAGQYRLYRLIAGRPDSVSGALNASPTPLRVLAGDSHDLLELVRAGAFREDLYYALSVTVLNIPPLRERQEDITPWADYFLQAYQKRYGRYVHLTKTAWQRMWDYPWPGNLAQLRGFCQRIVVGSPRRAVDEFFLDSLLRDGGPARSAESSGPASAAYQDPAAARIAELLSTCHGSRSAVAQALGISTTTLWRRMKKYGIQG